MVSLKDKHGTQTIRLKRCPRCPHRLSELAKYENFVTSHPLQDSKVGKSDTAMDDLLHDGIDDDSATESNPGLMYSEDEGVLEIDFSTRSRVPLGGVSDGEGRLDGSESRNTEAIELAASEKPSVFPFRARA